MPTKTATKPTTAPEKTLPPSGSAMIRNTQAGPSVLTWGKANNDYIMWEGVGDPNGGDIIEVPEDVLAMPQFRKMVKRGVFEVVVDQDEIDAADQAQQDKWENIRKGAHEETESVLERPQDKSFDVLTCIGPSDNPRSDDTCDAVITMKEADLKENPPLCARHKNLRGSYIPTDEVDENGKNSTRWSRVTIRR